MDSSSLLEKLKPHWLPILLGVGGLIFLVVGFFVLNNPKKDKPDILFEAANDTSSSVSSDLAQDKKKKITIDIEGGVIKSGVYSLPADSRIQDALIAAGGLSSTADRTIVAKSLNLAVKLTDGAKIYIPQMGDIVNGSGLAAAGNSTLGAVDPSATINLNTSSVKDLDNLPGIGEVTAQKIISGRPYGSVDELLSKKIVNAKVFAQIKDKLTVY